MNIKNRTGEYDIKRLSDDTIADVEKLHTVVYGKVPSHNFFKMKYDTAFTGLKHIGFIAYSSQQVPVAFYAVIPCFMRFDDKITLSAQSADTMTHPEHRNKGLFVELAELTFKLCRNAAIPFIFGFPNQNSLPGALNKLGWQQQEVMDCFIIRTSTIPWEKIINKLTLLKEWFRDKQQSMLKKYSIGQPGVANSVFNDGYAGVYRDHHFMKYKTYSDACVIKIGNATMWVKVGSIFLIGDMTVEPAYFDGAMYKLKRLARRLGIKEIHFHSSPGTTLHGLFAKQFKSIPSFPVLFKKLDGETQLNKIKFTSADIDTF